VTISIISSFVIALVGLQKNVYFLVKKIIKNNRNLEYAVGRKTVLLLRSPPNYIYSETIVFCSLSPRSFSRIIYTGTAIMVENVQTTMSVYPYAVFVYTALKYRNLVARNRSLEKLKRIYIRLERKRWNGNVA